MKVAILGATSHIAKNLIRYANPMILLSLYARSTENVLDFLKDENIHYVNDVYRLELFNKDARQYDMIINCIGVGKPEKLYSQGAKILLLTEQYDNLVLDYISRNSSTIYVNFSSGAIYGTDCLSPITSSSEFRITPSQISSADSYRVAKLNSETKHRAMTNCSIIDLRVFSFFSRFIDLGASFLINDIIKALKNKTEFVTNKNDIVRDYIHPQDLCNLVFRCPDYLGLNRSFDVYSKKPVRKSEVIDEFSEKFGLKVKFVEEDQKTSPTGVKNWYVSENRDAGEILDYTPQYNSLFTLIEESKPLLEL